PSVITSRHRIAAANQRLRWTNTFAGWASEIEQLAAAPVSRGQQSRRLVVMDMTNSAHDPANSGVINVARRLAAGLTTNDDLLVVRAVGAGESLVLPSAAQRSFIESYAGPEDWLGRSIEILGGTATLEHVLEAADPRCTRRPVLFLPEVVLDNSALRRIAW